MHLMQVATRGLEAPGAVIQRGSEAKEDLIGWMQDMTYISYPMRRRTQFLMTSSGPRVRWVGVHLNRGEDL